MSSSFHLYADNSRLYRHGNVNELPDVVKALNKDLAAIETWANLVDLNHIIITLNSAATDLELTDLELTPMHVPTLKYWGV